MRSFLVAVLAVLASCISAGQTSAPAFEVATVKPAPSTGGPLGIGLFTYPGGRIVASNCTLKQLIHDAYSLEMYQILGGPRWINEDRYQVEAKPAASSESSKWVPASIKTPPNPEMRQMLRTLLAERFQLRVHTETKQESVFVLVVAKGGPQLKEPTMTKQPFVSFGRTGSLDKQAASDLLIGENATMAQLVARLATLLRRPVLDQTELTGSFDFRVEYAGNDTQSENAPSLSQALQEQLKLKLETRPGSVEVLVIDRAEKPSAN